MFDELLKSMLRDELKESANEECKIAIVKRKNKPLSLEIEGTKGSILLTLAGLEKQILKNLEVSESTFNAIKELIDTKEADTIE